MTSPWTGARGHESEPVMRVIDRSLRTASLSAVLVLAGCGDDGGTGSATETTSASTTDDPTTGTTGSTGTTEPGTSSTTDDGSTGAPTGGTTGEPDGVEVIIKFDPQQFQLPEGLDVRDGKTFVGLVTGRVLALDVGAGTVSDFGVVEGVPFDNTVIMTGLIGAADGGVFVALDVFAPQMLQSGVYKIPAGGGAAQPFAADPALTFPNGFAYEPDGDLLVTDSFAGAVFHVALADGAVTPWKSDPLLAPDPAVCGLPVMFHLGANGIVHTGDRVFVTNSDQASILEIAVNGDGAAGALAPYLPSDCENLSGADGLIVEPGSGDLLVPVNYLQRVIRVTADKQIEVLADGEPLQSPATLALAPAGDAVLIANAAFEKSTTDPANALPAILSLPLQ
jgi:hypothetical protein